HTLPTRRSSDLRNYPKKKYWFPVTFPGFDAATVFIQKGAKAKFKRRMADPVKVKAKAKKVARLIAQNTRPLSNSLIDCFPLINQRETQTSLRDTNVSPKESFATKTHPATPPAFVVKKAQKETPLLDLVPELKS